MKWTLGRMKLGRMTLSRMTLSRMKRKSARPWKSGALAPRRLSEEFRALAPVVELEARTPIHQP